MCKSKFHGGPHCDEDPSKRRIRQRLGYHVAKAGNGDTDVLLPEVETRENPVPTIVTVEDIGYNHPIEEEHHIIDDAVTADEDKEEILSAADENGSIVSNDNNEVVTALVAKTPSEEIRELSTAINEQITNASNEEEFFLNGKEYSEKNLLDGITEREQQITYVGSLLASRADEIAGISPAEAKADWEARVSDSRVSFDQAVVDGEASSSRHKKLVDEIRSKYRVGTTLSPFSDEDEALINESKRLNNAEFDRTEGIKMAHGLIAQGFDPESQALLRRLSDGNMKAIAEFRELGGTINITDNSSKRAAKVLVDYVAPVIPKQWIENDKKNSEAIRVKDTTGRAHFAYSDTQESRKVVPSEASRSLSPGVELNRKDETFRDWRKTDETRKDGSIVWRGPEFEVLNSRDYPVDGKPPRGNGWEVRTVENMNMGSEKYVPAWVRAKNTTVVVSSASQPELLVPKISKKHRDANEEFSNNRMISIARHEAIHGIAERSNPHITTLEAKFLQRRTTSVDGKRDKLEKYNGSAQEKTRPDNFVSAYMGKEYSHGAAAEILTTGTEALFNGRFGGLAGIGEKRSDPDMRNFVLGLYASA